MTDFTPANGASGNSPPRIDGVTWACEVTSERVEWLWQDRIAKRSLNEIIADEGIGKSCLGARIVADATNGKLDGQDAEPTRVLVIAHEDSWKHTIKPRLQAAGADMRTVGFLMRSTDDGPRPVMFPRDTEFVIQSMSEAKAGLLYIDPFGSHVEVKKNSFDPDEIRRALAPLAAAAEAYDFAVLGIRHTNRSSSTSARSRSGSSLGYRQATRVQLILGKDPDAPDHEARRVLVGSKANISRKARAIRVRMELVPVDLDDGTRSNIICATFGELANHSDTDVLKATDPDAAPGAGRPSAEREEARAFIERMLGSNGGMRSDQFEEAARANGITHSTLKRARAELGVRAHQEDDGWYVRLTPLPVSNGRGS